MKGRRTEARRGKWRVVGNGDVARLRPDEHQLLALSRIKRGEIEGAIRRRRMRPCLTLREERSMSSSRVASRP